MGTLLVVVDSSGIVTGDKSSDDDAVRVQLLL